MFGLRSLPRTLEAALRDLRHAKNETRLSALGDLVRLSETSDRARALGALCEVMDSDAEVHVREMALAALGEIADEADQEARTLLNAARQDAAPEMRFQALIALNRIAHETLLDELGLASRDLDAEVRQIAYRLAEEHV